MYLSWDKNKTNIVIPECLYRGSSDFGSARAMGSRPMKVNTRIWEQRSN